MAQDDPDASRRTFLKTATLATGGALTIVVGVPLGRYLLFPVHHRVVSDPSVPVDVFGADELSAGGPPVKVQIFGQQVRDAWNVADGVALGSAYLRKTEQGDVIAYSSTCPHLGCAIGYDPGAKDFKCPCHRSAFGLDGGKVSGPSKRGLDTLDVTVVDGRVLVLFQRFRPDVAAKEVV